MEAQDKLSRSQCEPPDIQEHQIFENMKASKKTDFVPGDVPTRVLKEFLPELVTPVVAILREAVKTHTLPKQCKQEYHILIKKIPLPQNENDIIGIEFTPWISKQL